LRKKSLKLDNQACLQILKAVLDGDVRQAKASVKGNSGLGSKQSSSRLRLNPTTWVSGFRSGWKAFSGENVAESVMDDLIRRAIHAAMQISDSQFLGQLEQDVERYAQHIPEFGTWAERARHHAFEHLEVSIKNTVETLTPEVHKIQEAECIERINRESAKGAEEELDRLGLIKHVNDLSSRSAYSYVSTPFLSVDRDPGLTFVGIRCP